MEKKKTPYLYSHLQPQPKFLKDQERSRTPQDFILETMIFKNNLYRVRNCSISVIENLEDSRSLLCCELLNKSFELKMLFVSISTACNIIRAAKCIKYFLNCEGETIQALSSFKCPEFQAFSSREKTCIFNSIICLCGQQMTCDFWKHLLKMTNTKRSGLVKETGE